jgi:hypothetical protein
LLTFLIEWPRTAKPSTGGNGARRDNAADRAVYTQPSVGLMASAVARFVSAVTGGATR